jgi:hypothetical protein
MKRLKARDRKLFGEIQKFFELLENRADLGVPMHGEWEGCRRAHACDDKYRVIWRDLPEIADYSGEADETVVPVEVLRVGPKVALSGGTIYEQPNPLNEQGDD